VNHLGTPVGGRVSTSPSYLRCEVSATDGRFEFADLVPGEYNLTVSGPGLATQRVSTATLHPREELDLGPLVLAEPGWLRVSVDGRPGCTPYGEVWIGGPKRIPVSIDASTEWPMPLLPGSYELNASGDGLVSYRGKVEIRAGATQSVELPATRGVPCHVEVRAENGTVLALFLRFSLLRPDGEPVDSWLARGGEERVTVSRWPAPGRYTLRVLERIPGRPPVDGRSGEVELLVAPGGKVETAVTLR